MSKTWVLLRIFAYKYVIKYILVETPEKGVPTQGLSACRREQVAEEIELQNIHVATPVLFTFFERGRFYMQREVVYKVN